MSVTSLIWTAPHIAVTDRLPKLHSRIGNGSGFPHARNCKNFASSAIAAERAILASEVGHTSIPPRGQLRRGGRHSDRTRDDADTPATSSHWRCGHPHPRRRLYRRFLDRATSAGGDL